MLKDKIVLITGGGKGIGAAIAREMASQGAVVIINYSHSEAAAKEVQSEIRRAGGQADIFRCDVSDYNSVKAMTGDIIQHYGRLDILVNNAGIVKDGLLMRMKETDFNEVININLKGTFNCIQSVARQMLKQRYGRIINMSSVVGIYGNAGQVNYAASKAGIIGLTRSAAKELGSRGITVNAIAPGFIRTDMTDGLNDELKKKILSSISLGSFGTVEDIAHAACFLASDEARYITGQVLAVDGGISM